MTSPEIWVDANGNTIQVVILRRYLTLEDTCPKCEGGLRIAIARDSAGEQVYRLECVSCGWESEALPDPEAEQN